MRIGSAKESYALDAALFDSRTQYAWVGVMVVALCVFPFLASEYWLYLACLVTINIASTTGLNILTGYTGLVSLGQAAFMGLGAYTVAILQIRYASPFLLNLLAGGAVAMLAGWPAVVARERPVPGNRHDCGGRDCAFHVLAFQPAHRR